MAEDRSGFCTQAGVYVLVQRVKVFFFKQSLYTLRISRASEQL